jgi:uncharacterized RDD family membrane protein YckC
MGPVNPTSAAGHAQLIGLDPRLAQWWRRLLGWVIDSVIVGIPAWVLFLPVVDAYNLNYRLTLNNPDMDMPAIQAITGHMLAQAVTAAFAAACAAVAYYWLLTGLWGTTVGKRVLGGWVVAADGRRRLGMRSAFLRALVYVAGLSIAPFFLIDNLLLLSDRQLQCLHDRAAGTLVVKGQRDRPLASGVGGQPPSNADAAG